MWLLKSLKFFLSWTNTSKKKKLNSLLVLFKYLCFLAFQQGEGMESATLLKKRLQFKSLGILI